jgi:RimJ/RimL family protein N-acetyltransferase
MIDEAISVQRRLVDLRAISRDDYPTLFRWRSSLESVHALNFRHKVATYEEFVADLEPFLRNAMVLLVEDAKRRSPIGYAMAYNITPWDGWLTVAIYVEEAYRLKGHGGEAALLCVDGLFRWFPLRRIYTEIYDFAEPLVRLVRAMGFEEVGNLPDHFWYDDRYWSLHSMALTRERWETQREHLGAILDVQRRYDELARPSTDGQRETARGP